MAHFLSKRGQIDQELAQIVSKQQQLQLAQQEFLDTVSPTEQFRVNKQLDSINDELKACLRRVRILVAEVKRESDMTDGRIQAQIQSISINLRRQMEEHHRLESNFGNQVRSQARRRFEIAHPDATEEEAQAGVENILLGNETALFSVSSHRPPTRGG